MPKPRKHTFRTVGRLEQIGKDWGDGDITPSLLVLPDDPSLREILPANVDYWCNQIRTGNPIPHILVKAIDGKLVIGTAATDGKLHQ